MAEIVPVVSEALEAQIRELLPSQRGFGEDLQASNVITPIIDLTAVAQGTTTPQNLQTAYAFGSNTTFNVNNTTSSIISTTGFWRVTGVSTITFTTVGALNSIEMSDGLSSKYIWLHHIASSGTNNDHSFVEFDIVAFLRAGDSLSVTSGLSTAWISGSYRQIADVNGNLVYPVGFTPQ